MNIISGTLDFNLNSDSVVTIGKFDGVHTGHGEILKRMKKYAKTGLSTVVMTFDTPPSSILGNGASVLTTADEKRLILSQMGIDTLIEFPFYEKTASVRAEDFIEDYLVGKMHAKAVVVGTDCSFGYRAAGNAKMLKEFGDRLGFDVEVVNKKKVRQREISSTYLRELCDKGDVATIRKLSVKPYFVNGVFEHAGIAGQRFGMPYYVMKTNPIKHLPCSGVYYSMILFEEDLYKAVSYVDRESHVIETLLLGGYMHMGSEAVNVVLFDRMRDIMNFKNTAEEKKQLANDILDSEKWHKLNGLKGE